MAKRDPRADELMAEENRLFDAFIAMESSPGKDVEATDAAYAAFHEARMARWQYEGKDISGYVPTRTQEAEQ